MKRLFTLLAMLLPLASCAPTRIVTVSPAQPTVYTTVTTTKQTAITTQTYAAYNDPCLHLDLEAVAAAFAQSSNVREFEYLINNYSYIITNLDLNRDGYVDYLRVVETLDGYSHVFLIQAVLGYNCFQDVATLVVENPSRYGCYVELYGSPYLYGYNHYVRPVFVTAPNIYAHLRRANYSPWTSPYHWGNYPPHYKRPAPVYLSHYQAYVDTYMRNHHYCHKADYPMAPYYSNFDRVTRNMQRNDYGAQHPESSFSVRNADTAFGNSALERARSAGRASANASDMRAVQNASRTTTTSTTGRGTSSTATSSSTGRGTTSTATSSTTGRGTSSTATSTSTTGRGTTSTSTATTTTGRGTTSTSTSSSASRTGSTSSTSSTSTGRGTTSTSTGTTASRSTSTGSSSSATRTTGTTVTSRVNNSGSSGTTTRTTTSSGETSTVRRGSTSSSSSTATRSGSSTATRSGSSSTTSSTATRSGSSSSTSSTATRSGSSSSTSGRR